MDLKVDHYKVLGLPSGEEGTKLTQTEISKAYRAKALDLHPDKRPDDPDADANFQRLKSSYEILKDRNARRLFDTSLRAKREEQHHQNLLDWQHNNAAERGRNLSADREQKRRHCRAKLGKIFSDLEARAKERRWAPKGREARGRRAAANGSREVLFGNLEEVLKTVQHHSRWQRDATAAPERCSSISNKQENEEMLRGEYHLRLPLILLFFFAVWSIVDMYGVY